MTVRVNKYNLSSQTTLIIDDGLGNYLTQSKYLTNIKVDYSRQTTIDLLPNVETDITLTGNLKVIYWESLDPVAVAFKLDTQPIPQPIYTPPSLFGVLRFVDTLPLFVPDFIKVKSSVATSVVVVINGIRI